MPETCDNISATSLTASLSSLFWVAPRAPEPCPQPDLLVVCLHHLLKDVRPHLHMDRKASGAVPGLAGIGEVAHLATPEAI